MTIRAMNWAWEIDLQPALKLVLLKLADRANDDGECWPGQDSIAKACGVCERTVMRHIAKLEEMGLVRSVRRYGDDGKRTTNMYQLSLSDKLSHGLSDKSCKNHVTTVSPTYKEEPTIETTDATTKVAAPAGGSAEHGRSDGDRTPASIVDEPVRLDGVRWVVDDAVFDSWIEAYAGGRTHQDTEDWIEAELAKAAVWLQANPRKRKKNYLRFLSGWLTRAADSMRSRSQYQPRPYH